MKVLVVGGGGREHALVWRLRESGHAVTAAPGNPGIAEIASCRDVAAADIEGLADLAREFELVVIGPEAPLVAGLADRIRALGVPTFGPGADGARLEGSKIHAKEFFRRHDIPTPRGLSCRTVEDVEGALATLGGGVVVKADGLASGKGVVVCDDASAARRAALDMLRGRFGAASKVVLLEERLRGRELSVIAITDGRSHRILPIAEDHKALYDGDLGPNTGGMGAVSPAGWVSEDLLSRVERLIIEPTVRGLREDGIDYRGVLYAGLMITGGEPQILEYNCRFGDPEAQVIVPRVTGDFGALLLAAASGDLGDAKVDADPRTAVGVVLASEGYPENPVVGRPIRGAPEGVLVFHAGTALRDGELVTAGGRVATVVAFGDDLDGARARAYSAVREIDFVGVQFRTDIGMRRTSV